MLGLECQVPALKNPTLKDPLNLILRNPPNPPHSDPQSARGRQLLRYRDDNRTYAATRCTTPSTDYMQLATNGLADEVATMSCCHKIDHRLQKADQCLQRADQCLQRADQCI